MCSVKWINDRLVVEHFQPLVLFCSPITPFDFFTPLPLKITPKRAIPPTLRTTVLDLGFFVRDGVGFRPFWLRLPGPGCQPQEGIL